ncbi:MAG: xanthine dehydrogenase family protein subunit M [Calditrichaeota bacterium]|nr:xanthine dehydrogenase family protein subunit M [Calditrichota bacterium]
MYPAPFEYHRARSVDEAISLLSQYGSDAKLIAGGHSLLPMMKLRLATPAHLIDIRTIDGLQYIEDKGDYIAIGAGTSHAAIEKSDLLKQKMPLLPQAAAVIGDPQVRNMGTIGGSLAHADPAADYPAAVLAAGAQLVAVGEDGERVIPAEEFFVELFQTDLDEREILTEIRVPVISGNTRGAYLKFPHPASRFAIVGCAALVTLENNVCSDVRVAFTGVASTAFRDSGVEDALRGQPLNESTIQKAAEQAAESDELEIMEDNFASEDYRRHLAKVYAKRTLMQIASAF